MKVQASAELTELGQELLPCAFNFSLKLTFLNGDVRSSLALRVPAAGDGALNSKGFSLF